jgi:hypothetical protein
MRVYRTTEEISRVVEEFRASGLTRIEYSRRAGIALSTLSNYCRRHRARGSGLVRVEVDRAARLGSSFALVLARDRRVEMAGQFDEAELIRLIRAVEAA